VLDALEQALHERWPMHRAGLIHHSDRGSQGRFKWSSQRYLMRGYDDQMEAAIGSFRQGFFALARSTTSGGA
jgi:putative transposase